MALSQQISRRHLGRASLIAPAIQPSFEALHDRRALRKHQQVAPGPAANIVKVTAAEYLQGSIMIGLDGRSPAARRAGGPAPASPPASPPASALVRAASGAYI